MITNFPSNILNVSLFGSMSRNDCDKNSDLDVLVVVENGTGKASPDTIIEFIRCEYGKTPSLSWYGKRKITALFKSGDLFAWHLHLEAKALAGDSLNTLIGVPSEYTGALSDITDLREIARRVEQKVVACGANAVFEMGILYVCARNIAMAASWHLASTPSFGRYSPYDLPIAFPIAPETYETMLLCRMASQRGIAPPNVSSLHVLQVQKNILMWSKAVVTAVEKERSRDEQN
ncbi:nucleotidyltransferase domain-containing protein [Brucella anthropi]|uniref:nucleotidyltransferase domain-containing protein n=1 Tax=Brucella anthropi TaxID=529 RepID=UPI003D95901C